MVSREVFPGILLWPVVLVGLPAAILALVAAAVLVWRKRTGLAAGFAVSAPLCLALSWTLLDYACVAQVVVANISSPKNEFRARTLVRDAGATTSWALRVEVGTRGWADWKWTPVFRTYHDIPAEILWRNSNTLVIRSHRSKHAERLATSVAGIEIEFEDCPAASEQPNPQGPYVNGC